MKKLKKWKKIVLLIYLDAPKEQGYESDAYKTIFVYRIGYNTSEERLKEEFSKFGEVKSIHLIKDKVNGNSRGYAFIEYTTEKEFNYAVTVYY